MPIIVRISLIIVAILEWAVLSFLTFLGLTFGVATQTASFFVWIPTIVAVGYPIVFGLLFFLFRKKLGNKKWYWFIAAFNIFPIVLYFAIGLLDRIGLY